MAWDLPRTHKVLSLVPSTEEEEKKGGGGERIQESLQKGSLTSEAPALSGPLAKHFTKKWHVSLQPYLPPGSKKQLH